MPQLYIHFEANKLHAIPIQQWVAEGATFKFIGDNVDKKRGVHDVRSDHSGQMIHDMVDIIRSMQGYLGDGYPSHHCIASGGDHLTCERQIGAQRHLMDGDSPAQRLQLLEPHAEDWHCLLCILSVSTELCR